MSPSPGKGPLPFEIGDLTLRHGAFEHGAMVITPKSPMVIGQARIDQLRGSTGLSPVERRLIEEVKKRGARARVVLFRAMNARNERVWQFDSALGENELEDAGFVMSKALLPLHRRLMAAGVMLMVHTDWGLRECYAMRRGIDTLVRELESAKVPGPTEEADRWMLSNMLLHLSLGLNHVTGSLLPTHLTMIDRRWQRVRALVAKLPADAID